MRYIIFLLTILFSVSIFADDDILVKTDGTKYYIQVYDGVTNEKVLQYAEAPGWQYRIFTGDYFDGSDKQLWSFEATDMFPGYFSIVNHHFGFTHHLMSYNWFAYFTDADNRDPKSDKEMQFKFVDVGDGYFKLETIEKPTDGSLYGINYTPGADALNVDENGQADFGDVKSADIGPGNLINNVFKLVEFNPMQLFEESIVRGDDFYNNNPNAPEKVRYDLFYMLEKAREVRVFGSEGEMLSFQANIDEAINNFKQAISLLTLISDARTFIAASTVDADVKSSFNAIVDEAEVFLNSEDLVYADVDGVKSNIESAQGFVNVIVDANAYNESLADQDARLSTGMQMAIDSAKLVLADMTSDASTFTAAGSYLTKTEALLDEIIAANDLIAATQEFQEAKDALTVVVESAIATVNTAGVTSEQLDVAVSDVKAAVKAFQKALEAGDTVVELINADFANGKADWNIDSPDPTWAYPENKGVDGSKSITFYSGQAYKMKFFQSISNIPNGKYQVSCFAKVNKDNSIAVFAESGGTLEMLPVVGNALEQRTVTIDVTNGSLDFGVKGVAEDNSIPGSNWIVFDEFEVKWLSTLEVANADFSNDLTGWMVEGKTNAAYGENKGVDGSRSITCWSGSAYEMSISQTLSIPNGTYSVSVMANTNQDSTFVVFGESAGTVGKGYVTGGGLTKAKAVVQVSDGALKFGIRGAGEGNTVPANRWIVFDNIEVVRMPDIPVPNTGFESDLTGWLVEGKTAAAYAESRSVDGSRSITCWSGGDYSISISQTMTDIFNGTYAISVMAKSSMDGAFEVFGESDGLAGTAPINGAQFNKSEALATVNDGSMKFGVRGAGENNLVPGGKWIIFDMVEVKIKSIIPVYMTPDIQQVATSSNTISEEKAISYAQFNGYLNVRSSESIAQYTVYSLNGSRVDQKQAYTNEVMIPMSKGVFVVRIITNDGMVHNKKVFIK